MEEFDLERIYKPVESFQTEIEIETWKFMLLALLLLACSKGLSIFCLVDDYPREKEFSRISEADCADERADDKVLPHDCV